MRLIKFVALAGAVSIFFGCLILYRMADHTLYAQEESEHRLRVHQSSQRAGKFFGFKMKSTKANEIMNISTQKEEKVGKSCKRPTNDIIVNIQMSDVYKELKFDNLDGGVWKQGWNIETDPNRWNAENKLKVFVVPHSHNDPGWLKTFEDYYRSETVNILNHMLKKLSTDQRKKFIWAEISFFSLWWDGLSEQEQEKVKKLVENKQLEMVTGGWVMNDEANAHYFAILTQLTEGHQWMKTNLKVEPKSGWTIDPFGVSSVMPYLLKKMGLENLVIQRVHYSIKKYFAKSKNLEFRWRQVWDNDGVNDLFTHMMPFYSYDVPHTCGPDPKICCQFDFKRLPGNGVSCPWKIAPKPITKKNVAMRAQLLLDQYRKKSELYKTNVILVPLGDDFRYQQNVEWDHQFENYYMIMDYINSNPQLHAEVKFGTLSEFFTALKEESSVDNFPTLIGDFFTYADRDDHYWSGYYTSRPFFKKLDRTLINYYRAAEILFALGWSSKTVQNSKWLLSPQTGFAKMLRDSRRSLGLFQHHDGITGTARDNVMEDYAQKMLDAISNSQDIIQQVTYFFLSSSPLTYPVDTEQTYFDFDDQQKRLYGLPEKNVLVLGEYESQILVFFNSLTRRRKEVVSVQVASPYLEILDYWANSVLFQVTPVFSQDAVMDDSRFEISFVADVPALGLATYRILMTVPNGLPKRKEFARVKVFNAVNPKIPAAGFEDFEIEEGREFSIENQFISLALSENGLLKSVMQKQTMDFTPLHLDFIRYLARPNKESSGAYLFLPEGEAKIVKTDLPLIRLYEGPIFTRVEVKLKGVKHYLTLYNAAGLENLGIEIVNVVDITNESNYELGMRISSHIKSRNLFYTDLNGFQMIKRERFAKLPIQGNYYPMPTAAFIEDEKTRLTIVSGQPLGVSSLKEGEMEVLQDRRLQQDDNRGLGQGVTDNKITPNIFRILVERRLENCNSPPVLLSASAHTASQSLLNPLVKMFWKHGSESVLEKFYFPVEKDLPHDLHLVSVRTFDEEEIRPSAGFVFHRPHLDHCFVESRNLSDGIINLKSFLPNNFGDEVKKSSLSFLKKDEEKMSKEENFALCHLDFLSLLLS